jgi:hypothetical protein
VGPVAEVEEVATRKTANLPEHPFPFSPALEPSRPSASRFCLPFEGIRSSLHLRLEQFQSPYNSMLLNRLCRAVSCYHIPTGTPRSGHATSIPTGLTTLTYVRPCVSLSLRKIRCNRSRFDISAVRTEAPRTQSKDAE